MVDVLSALAIIGLSPLLQIRYLCLRGFLDYDNIFKISFGSPSTSFLPGGLDIQLHSSAVSPFSNLPKYHLP